MPVAASNALTFSLNLTSSAPANAPKAVTLAPLNLPAIASVSSGGMADWALAVATNAPVIAVASRPAETIDRIFIHFLLVWLVRSAGRLDAASLSASVLVCARMSILTWAAPS